MRTPQECQRASRCLRDSTSGSSRCVCPPRDSLEKAIALTVRFSRRTDLLHWLCPRTADYAPVEGSLAARLRRHPHALLGRFCSSCVSTGAARSFLRTDSTATSCSPGCGQMGRPDGSSPPPRRRRDRSVTWSSSSTTILTLSLAAFAPGVTFFLSFFYSRREVGFRQG